MKKRESIITKLVFSFLILITLTLFLSMVYAISIKERISDDSIFIYSVITLIVINVIGMSFAFIISRSIASPLHKFKEAILDIRSGNYNTFIDIESNDEFFDLAQAFNNMSSTINSTIDEFKRLEELKTHFLGITAHELRTPVTTVKLQAEMLKDKTLGKLNTKQVKSVNILFRNVKRLDKLISDVLDLTRLESAKVKFNWELCDINLLVKKTVDQHNATAKKKKIKLLTHLGNIADKIDMDADRFMQVVDNLIFNAIKFTPEKGKVTISTSHADESVLVSVEDTGIGLVGEDLDKIFLPFYQVDARLNREYGGSGLGLSICKGLIEIQGGRFWVQSRGKDKGSTFFFTVPYKPLKENHPMIKLMTLGEKRVPSMPPTPSELKD